MKPFAYAALFSALLLGGCDRGDRYKAREKTKEAGRELKHDAEAAKEKIKEGWQQTKKEVKEDVKKLKEHDRP